MPARLVREKIDEMGFHEFANRCRFGVSNKKLLVGLRHPGYLDYGRFHQSMQEFNNTFPKYHVVRVRDLWQKKLHRGNKTVADPDTTGGRLPNPHYWEWCKWMLILHKP